MRGDDERSGSLFSYVDVEARVGKDHPLRTIRGVVNEALASLSSEFSGALRADGSPLDSAREAGAGDAVADVLHDPLGAAVDGAARVLALLFRWFVGMGVDDRAWDHSTFSKNRERLLEGDIAAKLLSAVMAQPRVKRLLSSDHFSVDGTLIEAWASMKSFRPRDGIGRPAAVRRRGNREADFHWSRSARMRRTPRRPIRRRGFTARGRASKQRSSASWDMR